MLLVQLIDQSYADNAGDKTFTWSVREFEGDQMRISLNFDEPLMISKAGDRDKIRVTFANTSLIFDTVGQNLQEGTQVEKAIPPQFANDSQA